MKNIYVRLLMAAFFCGGITAHAQTIYKLDWASSFGTWTNGQTSGTATSIGGSGVNCSVTMTASGGIFSVTSTTPAYQTPTVTNSIFFVPGSSSCMRINMDFTANTQYTDVVYTFSSPVTGIKFNVVDIDKVNATSTTYHDKIIVTGSNGPSLYYPAVSKYVVSSDILGSVAGNTAVSNITTTGGGNSASSTTDQTGTVTVDFGTAALKTITVRYTNGGNTDADPAVQAIGIGNISFLRTSIAPVANNFTNVSLNQGAAATFIPALTASDADGTIASYSINSVPSSTQGVLSIPCPATPAGATCTGGYADLTATVLTANGGAIIITPAQAAAIKFDPAAGFTGITSFNFTATDNSGLVSNSAIYNLPLIAQPPAANNIMENSMVNTASTTAIQPLSATDVDGTIATYQITTLPTVGQGVLSVPCPPTFTSATCTGGYQDLTAAVLAAYPSGIPLSATQMAAMKFDPTAAFVGNAIFTYNAVDNSGNTSNMANYTIPVASVATTVRPPLADNITAQFINNSLSSTAIPALQATDLQGTISSYKVVSLPAGGTLYCCGGTAITSGQVLTPAQVATLQFDPLAGFVGTASFTYTATNNSALVSNVATYSIPVINRPPTATNLSVTIPYNAPATAISPLAGYDADGTITSYTVTSVPASLQGVISVSCPPTVSSATCTGGFQDLTPAVLLANSNAIVLTPAQAASIRFRSAAGFTGTAPFTYTTTDNNNNVSAAAIYTLLVDAQPPVSTDVTVASIANSAAATSVTGLNGTDADGTIASYLIQTLPAAAQGVLSIPCPGTLTGATCTGGYQDLTTAILNAYPDGIPLTTAQAAGIKFDPVAGYGGVASFVFNSVDNSGLISNTANYNIPVSGSGNIAPVAKNIATASISNGAGSTIISGLTASDADGTVASYTINSVPSSTQGVLSIPCPATPAGATCTGGYADLTAAVLTANGGGIIVTPAQAAAMKFGPMAGFTGTVNFSYLATDNSGSVSYQANYSVPVTGVPPVATSVTATSMSQIAGATTIPTLTATDADGTIATYYIESLPPANQGVISIPCPVTLTGATCTGGYQNLTPSVMSNYPGGLPLTTAQAAGMRFTPSVSFAGNVVFNYHADDNTGALSNTATYIIPVSGLNPQSADVIATKMFNGNSATAIAGLNSIDADGTIATYVISSLPASTQGVVSIPCPATPAGATCTGGYADLTAAVLTANPGGIVLTPVQAAAMKFDPAGGFTGNAVFNYLAYDNNNNLSNIATYNVPVGSSVTLPVSLLNFSGERNGSSILLNWKVENEVNVKEYEIEYSTDGASYKYGGTTAAKNLSVNNYHFTLLNFTSSIYYIRLKSIEADGKIKYSSVIVIRLGNDIVNSLALSPNPVTDKLMVTITSGAAGEAAIVILNVVGEPIYKQALRVVKGDNIVSVNNMPVAANGSYLLQVSVNGKRLTQKFIINK